MLILSASLPAGVVLFSAKRVPGTLPSLDKYLLDEFIHTIHSSFTGHVFLECQHSGRPCAGHLDSSCDGDAALRPGLRMQSHS